jgi:hypothetical protein
MKKFFAIAAMAALATSSAFAYIGEDPQTREQCVTCDESPTTAELGVCTYVAVPLCVTTETRNMILDCLYRPGYYKNPTNVNGLNLRGAANYNNALINNTLNPANPGVGGSNDGIPAYVSVGGDENDDINVTISSGLDAQGRITLNHVAHDGQYSDDNVNNPTSFKMDLWMWVFYHAGKLPTFAGGPAATIKTNTLVDFTNAPVSATRRVRIGDGNDGAPVATGAGFVGLKFGGVARVADGQQRGEYRGAFAVNVAYVP